MLCYAFARILYVLQCFWRICGQLSVDAGDVKVRKRGSPHLFFIPLTAADFMEVPFAVCLNEKVVKFDIKRFFDMCTVKRTRFRLVTHNYNS